MRFTLIVLVVLLVTSCMVGTRALSAADCDSVLNADTLLRPGVVVLLGEIHGTKQGPELLATLACRALDLGLKVIVGLEIPIEEQSRIDLYLQGSVSDRDSLIAGQFWQRDYQDGRASRAMAGLIETLRILKSDSASHLRVLALDNPDAPEGRDWFMAQRLISALADSQEVFTIALTGNIHNRLTMGTHFNPEYEPMGYHVWLHRPENEVISLDIVYSGGTAWVDAGDSGYGVLELGGAEGEPGLELYRDARGEPYSGRCHVGTISASLPAKDQ